MGGVCAIIPGFSSSTAGAVAPRCGVWEHRFRMAAAPIRSYDAAWRSRRPGRCRGKIMGAFFRCLTACAAAVLGVLAGDAALTGVAAREFRAADIQEENYPTVQALMLMGKLV